MGSHTPGKAVPRPEDNLPPIPRPPEPASIQGVLTPAEYEPQYHDAYLASPLMGRPINNSILDPNEASRAERRRVNRDSNPFVNSPRPHSNDTFSPPTFVAPDLILPPIDESRCDHGLSQDANGSRQPLRLPSLSFDFDPNGLGRSMLPPDSPQEDADVVSEGGTDGSNAQPPHEVEVPQDTKCEFITPCKMKPSPDGMHYRKVISHIFGRNKATTKLFPGWVWTHYCRKHYQRARYRADRWPFTQCELLLESLSRMESWGGVRSFQLVLRRREQLRTTNANAGGQTPGQADRLSSGRKHPTAVTSPAPDWLRRRANREMNFADARQLILRIRAWMAEVREEQSRQAALSGIGQDASGEQTRVRQQQSSVRFPDVEIIPVFEHWVVNEATHSRNDQGHADNARNRHDHAGEDNEEVTNDQDDAPPPAPAPAPELDRTGMNSGRSASQRRRSERTLTSQVSGGDSRVDNHGAVKKPNVPKPNR